MLFLSCNCYVVARVCLLIPCGHLLGKGLTSLLSFVMSICVFVTLPCGILGQVLYLIASKPDLWQLSYFKNANEYDLETQHSHTADQPTAP